jgi:periplasmic divalent cation tolerance protein
MSSEVLVYSTFSDQGEAASVCRTLVKERLAACCTLLPQALSIYEWQAEIQQDAEVLALMKTTSARFSELQRRLLELHPYDCPEVIAVPIEAGNPAYLDWLQKAVAASA